MFSKLKRWDLRDIFEMEEDRRMARVQLNIIAFNCFLSLIVLVINQILWQDNPFTIEPLTMVLLLGYGLHLILFALVIKKHLYASSLLLTSAYVLMISTIATIGGGLHDYVIMMYPVAIMYAGLTAQKRGLIFATLLTFAGLGWLVFGEIFGWFVITVSHIANQTDLVVSLILITLAAWMVHILISNVEYGLTQTWQELAERKRVEEALKKSETLYRLLAENVSDVIWIFDANANHLRYISPSVERLTGYTVDEALNMGMDEMLHPTAFQAEQEVVESRLRAFREGRHENYVSEVEQPCKDGSTVWVEATASYHVNEANGHFEVYGVSRDITERKRMEQALHEMRSRLQLLGENLEEAALYVYSHDANGQPHFEYLSASMEKVIGVTPDEIIQDASRLHALILPEYMPKLVELEEKSKQELIGFEVEVRQRHAVTGNIHWALLRSTPRRRPDGSTVWYGVQMDITERKRNEKLLEEANGQLRADMEKIGQLQAELREQAIRDPLTGLFNRRYLNETLVGEITRSERENVPLTVIMSDIDHFKIINDTYGHPVGDTFLVEIARLMKNHARGSDIVCRYGGEEFLLVLPGTPLEAASNRAEELRQKCAEIIIQHKGKALKVTMSFGVATYPNHGKEAVEIIIKADKALYQSKHSGRNQVTAWSENQ